MIIKPNNTWLVKVSNTTPQTTTPPAQLTQQPPSTHLSTHRAHAHHGHLLHHAHAGLHGHAVLCHHHHWGAHRLLWGHQGVGGLEGGHALLGGHHLWGAGGLQGGHGGHGEVSQEVNVALWGGRQRREVTKVTCGCVTVRQQGHQSHHTVRHKQHQSHQ